MRAAILTPLYLSVSWVLTVSYQLFTETAVKTLAFNVNFLSPTASTMLTSNIDMIVFIYAFTWIFVLSSVIPSLLLGKERSVLTQYFVCLILSFLAFTIQSILVTYGGGQVQQLFSVSTFLSNPILAVAYLAIPYIVMLGLDIRARKARKRATQSQYIFKEVKNNKKPDFPTPKPVSKKH